MESPAQSRNYMSLIELKPGKMIYILNHQLLTADSLAADDSLRWTMDGVRGRFILLSPVDSAKTVRLYYHTPDFSLPQQLKADWIWPYQPKLSQQPEPAFLEPVSELQATGTLFRSIQINSLGGNQIGAGLDLRLSGELAPGYRISGAIADQSVPTQAYSSTQSLEELDRIYLMLENEKLNGETGDIRVRAEWGSWLRISRELMGLNMRYKSADWQSAAILGGAKGRWHRQIVPLQNGVQGPYRLEGENSESAISIVPGSEQVWYNGRLLKSHEYTLYLQEAELILEPAILPKPEDRLIVEFSYRNELYSRNTVGAMIGREGESGRSWRLALLQEGDNANNPLDITLAQLSTDSLRSFSQSEKKFLSTAYPDSNGAYLKQDDYFVYQGENKGAYSVIFYREKEPGGYVRQYDQNGHPYYKYAPDESGSVYYPRRYIRTPSLNRILTGTFRQSWKNGAQFSIDAAVNDYQANLWLEKSSLTKAASWQLAFPLVKKESPLSIHYQGWLQEMNFQPFERLLSPDYQRDFALKATDTLTQQQTLSLDYSAKSSRHQFQYTIFTIGESGSQRQKLSFSGSSGAKLRWQYEGFRLFEKRWLPYYHWQSSLQFPLWKVWSGVIQGGQTRFEPFLEGIWPQWRDEGAIQVSFKEQLSMRYILETNKNWQDTSFIPAYQNQDWQLNWQSKRSKALNSQLSVRLRNSNLDKSSEQFLSINQNSRLRLGKQNLTGHWQTTVQSVAESKLIPIFIYVGQGLGQYRWDEAAQDYVSDLLGDHILRREKSGELQTMRVHSQQWQWRWQKNRLFATELQFIWQHQGKGEFRGDNLIFWRFLSADSLERALIYGQTRFRNEFQLRPLNGAYRLSLSIEDDGLQNLLDQWQAQLYDKVLWQLKFRRFLMQSNWEISLAFGERERLRLNRISQQLKAKSWQSAFIYELNIGEAWRINTTVTYSKSQVDYLERFPLTAYEIKESINWNRRPQERLSLEGTYSRVATAFQQQLPWDLAEGKQPGGNYQFMGRYERSLSENLSMNMMVQLRQFADQNMLTLIRMELRAYF
jgi:hypothetical protein